MRAAVIPALLALLVACGREPASTEGPVSDRDGDGVPDTHDCGPDDPAVHPGAVEVCDGLDQDCDGVSDEHLPTSPWYADADGDGVGASGEATLACGPASGMVAATGDCDDSDATVYPGAPEHCDGADHDCDGLTWELDSVDVPTWYVDADTDGYGDPARPVVRCLGEEALALVAGDCDDSRADVSPVGREVCDATGADEDCDGLTESEDPDAVPGTSWYIDADHDREGGPYSVPATACVPPLGYAWTNTDCDDADPAVFTTTWYADGDGDGYARAQGAEQSCEPLEGRSPDSRDCDDRGPYTHPGAPDRCGDGLDADCNGVDCFLAEVITGGETWVDLGAGLTAGGDLTGDGVEDVVVGFLGPSPGGAVILPGPVGVGMAGGPTVWLGATAAPMGMALSLLDVDGDGGSDLAFVTDDVADGEPGIVLLRGPVTADVDLSGAPDRLLFLGEGTAAGDVDRSDDLTGDGAPDLVVGFAAHEGAAVFVTDAAFGGEVTLDTSHGAAIYAGDGVDRLGWTHATGHDLDGDGVDDLAFSVDIEEFPGETIHQLMVAFGPLSGDMVASDADVVMDGSLEDDPDLGGGLHILPDLDGDGLDDVVAPSPPDIVVVNVPTPGAWGLWELTRARLEDVLEVSEIGGMIGGDFDMDLRGDIAISCDAAAGGAGVIRLYSGPFSGTITVDDARSTWEATGFAQGFGRRLENVGDLDGTGRDSLVVTATDEVGGPDAAGVLYLLQGRELP